VSKGEIGMNANQAASSRGRVERPDVGRVLAPTPESGKIPVSNVIVVVLSVAIGVASFPWFRFQLGLVDTSPMHVAIIGICGMYAMRGIKLVDRMWTGLAVAFIAFLMINFIGAVDDPLSIILARRLIVKVSLCLITAFGMAALVAQDDQFMERFIGLTSSVIMVIGLGLFYYSFFVLGDTFINVSPTFDVGSDVNRNLSGFSFAFAAAASFALSLHRRSSAGFARAIILMVLTVLSGSRGAVIAGAAGVASCALIQLKNRRMVMYVIVLAMLGYFFRASMPAPIATRLFAIFDSTTGSLDAYSGRDELFRIAFVRGLSESPIVGHGTGTSFVYNSRFLLGRPTDPHSDLNLLAIEGGLVGLGLYGGILAVLVAGVAKVYMRSSPGSLKLPIRLCISLMVVVILHGLVETQIDLMQVWIVYGLTWGVVYRCRQEAFVAWRQAIMIRRNQTLRLLAAR
jgi:hypothetical protein